MLVPLIQGFHRLIPLGIQLIQQLISKVFQPVLLAEPGFLLPVKSSILPDQQRG